MHRQRVFRAAMALAAATALVVAGLATAATLDTRVTTGNAGSPFSQNKQNEPAVTVNPVDPSMLVAGANDEIDLEACAAGNRTSCPFTGGVGVSGVYFSSNGGASWTQPTYTGWSARGCLGPTACAPASGPIGTLPGYLEAGLVSGGDLALAFGPKPGSDGTFSWGNGQRLYYANLASNFSAVRSETAFKGSEAVVVSRTDNVAAAAAGDASAWKAPVIISKQNSALFSDKEGLWVDNAASSPHFGNAYVCNVAFRGNGAGGGEPVLFTRSTDGGDTWSGQLPLSSATNTSQTGGRQGCAIRTDSHGVVYVVWEGTDIVSRASVQFLTRSFDGGLTFERPRIAATVTDVGLFDPTTGRGSFDGVGGARTDSFPSFDIANGAPSGAGATNAMVMTWSDGTTPTTISGPNERAAVTWSVDGGTNWSASINAAATTDRPDFPAIAISPDGSHVYLTYDSFGAPWQSTTGSTRPMEGVVRSVAFSSIATPSAWTELHRAVAGDARGSSQNNLVAEFLGDYNSVVATNDFGYAVWNDVRNATDCAAVDTYRQNLASGSPAVKPAPGTVCDPTFGNSDIYGGAYTAP